MTNNFRLNFSTQNTMEWKLRLATTDVAVWTKAWHEAHDYRFLEAANLALHEQNELYKALRKDP